MDVVTCCPRVRCAVQLAVREELARTQEIAVKLDAMFRLAEDEAAQLRVQFKAQEDDRQHLVRCDTATTQSRKLLPWQVEPPVPSNLQMWHHAKLVCLLIACLVLKQLLLSVSGCARGCGCARAQASAGLAAAQPPAPAASHCTAGGARCHHEPGAG
jgi:hypothetical protein